MIINTLKFSKSAIGRLVGIEYDHLNNLLTEETKQSVKWEPGRQTFTDKQVFTMLRELLHLYTDEQITALIHPELAKN
jgi:hypothetical protein